MNTYKIELAGEAGFQEKNYIVWKYQLCEFIQNLAVKFGSVAEPSENQIKAAIGGDCIMISDIRQIQINENDGNDRAITPVEKRELAKEKGVGVPVIEGYIEKYGNVYQMILNITSSINEVEDTPIAPGLTLGESKT